MHKEIFSDLDHRMKKGIDAFKKDLGSLRTGRASASILDPIKVDAYGSQMPLDQLGTISVPEARMISIQVWDKTMVKFVEKAIIESNLQLNPVVDGTLIRIPMPELSEERRKEIVKTASKYTEAAKVVVRNIRRDGMDALKKLEKDGDISEDDFHRFSDDVQELTDKFIKQIDELFHHKEADLLKV